MKIYLLNTIDVTQTNWPRLQGAEVDRVLGTFAINSFGVENDCPWIEIAETELPKVVAPVTYSTQAPGRVITKLAFRRMFTQAERVAFDNYETNSSLTDAQRAVLRTFTKDLEAAQEVTLNDAELIAGLQYLEGCGILAAGRASEIIG